MKNKKLFSSVIILLIITLIASIGFTTVYATEEVSGNVVENVVENKVEEAGASASNVLTTGTTTTPDTKDYVGDLYCINEVITSETDVDGNLFLMGKDVMINDCTITGDIFVLALNLTIDDTVVSGNIFAMAQNLSITGETVASQLYACGQNITTGPKVNILKDMRVAGSDVKVSSTVGHNAYIGADSFELQGKIMGDLDYEAKEAANIKNDQVAGNVRFREVEPEQEKSVTDKVKEAVKDFATMFIGIIIIGLVFIFIDRKFLNTIYSSGKGEAIGKSLLFALLGIFVFPLVALILLVTGVGSLPGLALFYSLLLAAMISIPAFVALLTGIFCKNKFSEDNKANRKAAYGRLVLLALAFSILSAIPVLGIILDICAIPIGFGAIIRNVFYKGPKTEVTE